MVCLEFVRWRTFGFGAEASTASGSNADRERAPSRFSKNYTIAGTFCSSSVIRVSDGTSRNCPRAECGIRFKIELTKETQKGSAPAC